MNCTDSILIRNFFVCYYASVDLHWLKTLRNISSHISLCMGWFCYVDRYYFRKMLPIPQRTSNARSYIIFRKLLYLETASHNKLTQILKENGA